MDLVNGILVDRSVNVRLKMAETEPTAEVTEVQPSSEDVPQALPSSEVVQQAASPPKRSWVAKREEGREAVRQ